MDVCKLNRTKKDNLSCGRKLRPICPVDLFQLPSIREEELGGEIQRYATERVEELQKRSNKVFYDFNAQRTHSSPTGDDWVYMIALQLYEKIR